MHRFCWPFFQDFFVRFQGFLFSNQLDLFEILQWGSLTSGDTFKEKREKGSPLTCWRNNSQRAGGTSHQCTAMKQFRKKNTTLECFLFFFLKIEKKISVIFNQQTDSNWTNATWKNCQQISQHWCKPGKKPRHSSTHIDHHCFELSPHRNMFSIIDLAKDTILCLTSWLHTS